MTREQARREIDSLDFYLQNHTDDYGEESHTAMMMAIEALSSSEKPKMGKWEYIKKEDSYKCSLCGFPCHKDNLGAIPTKYCAGCGAVMERCRMTREEAIKNIKEHCYFANLIPPAQEALDMAIKALEQEPCGDCISREKYFEDIAKAYGNGYKAGYKEGFDFSIGEAEQRKFYENGLNDAWEAVRKILHLNQGELCKVFPMDSKYRGDYDDGDIAWIDDYSASEVIEKIHEYEENVDEMNINENVMKEQEEHIMLDDVQVKECYTCYHCGDMFRGYGDRCYDPCEGCKENGYKNYKKE